MSKGKTPEQFEKELLECNEHFASGQLTLTNPAFTRCCDKVGVHCTVCGATYETTAAGLLKGVGCRCCCKNLPGTDEELRTRLAACNPRYAAGLFRLAGVYVPRRKLGCICSVCGSEWEATAPQLLSGSGCPSCGRGSGTSRTQEFITAALEQVLGADAVVSRSRDTIGLELDVCIPSAGIAIEVGAHHWHPDPAAEVANKRALCARRGLRLVGFFEGTRGAARPTGLPADWGWHDEDLFDEPGRRTLTGFVCRVAEMAGHPVFPDGLDWEKLAAEAVRRAMPADTAAFEEKLRRRNAAYANGDFVLLSRYCGDRGAVQCRCSICGHRWSTTAGALAQGCACPNYREHPGWVGSNTLSHEEFLQKLMAKNPSFADGTYEIVGRYRTITTKIKCHCNLCGNDWEMTPRSLYQNGGCRHCGRKERGKARRKTTEEFRAHVDRVNRHYDHGHGFEIVGEYTGDRDRIRCRCLACGHEWDPMATSLVHSSGPSGCPACAKVRVGIAHRKNKS